MTDSDHGDPPDPRREAMLRDAAGFLARSPNANLVEIAAACGVSRATLHRYFPGRDALVEALLERADSFVREAATRADLTRGDHVEALRRLIAAFGDSAPFTALLYTLSKEDDDASDQAWTEADRMIISFFEDGQRAQVFAPNITATWMAEAFYALTAAGEWAIISGRTARRDAPTMIEHVLLRGIGAEDRPRTA